MNISYIFRCGVFCGAFFSLAVALSGIPVLAREGSISFNRIDTAHGLPQNHVYCVMQDSLGFMWFGTRDGLARYDGYEFKTYRQEKDDPGSLTANYVYSLYEDDKGYIWIATLGGGLCRYDRYTDSFEAFRHNPQDPQSIASDTVNGLARDEKGNLWLATQEGLCRMSLAEPGRFIRYQADPEDPTSLQSNVVWRVMIDRLDRIWVGTLGGGLSMMGTERNGIFHTWRYDADKPDGLLSDDVWSLREDGSGRIWVGVMPGGLHLMHPDQPGVFEHFPVDIARPDGVGPGRVQDVMEDSEGTIWVANMGGGLFRLVEPENGARYFVRYRHDYGDVTSPSHDFVWCLFEDRSGLIWFGTYGGGLNRFDPVGKGFIHYKPDPDSGRLPYGEVSSFAEDDDGMLWIGVSGGGLCRFNPKDGTFQPVPITTPDKPDDVIVSITSLLRTGKELFVGSFDAGLFVTDAPDPGAFTNYRFDPTDAFSLSNNEVRCLLQDRTGDIWLGTVNGGLNRMKPDEPGRFLKYVNSLQPGSISDSSILSLLEDRLGFLWVGTWGGGLNRMDPERQAFEVFRSEDGNHSSLAHDVIWSLFEDSQGVIWVGTTMGLSRYDRDSGTFQTLNEEDGLPGGLVHGIRADNLGLMWMSTNKGLAEYDPQTGQFRTYDIYDGLQGNQFYQGAHWRTNDGALLFGGRNGFNIFYPDNIREKHHFPQLAVTDFLLANQSAKPWRLDAESPLAGAPEVARHIVLNHTHNIFSFTFAVLDYAGPQANKYQYKLTPFNENWVKTTAGNRIATYTNLDPGEYTFHFKGGTKDGVWDEEGIAVQITVLPPLYGTRWAFALYILAGAGLVYWMLRQERRKKERDRELIDRLRQVDRMKDEFLANTSHELRTPLNGIIGLAESLRDGVAGELSKQVRGNLDMIVSSGRRLASLVNDILDFSKLRNRGLTLRLQPLDLHALVEVVLTLSRPLTSGKDLSLVNEVPNDLPAVRADESRLEQVLHNLIGNAIKFTHRGQVVVTAVMDGDWIEVSVTDTGIGIPEDKLGRIFGSFEQGDASTARDYGGTGLGLAISRQLVALHGGAISATSEVGKGTTLSFTLPATEDAKVDIINRERRVTHLHQVEETEPEEAVMTPAPLVGSAATMPVSSFQILVVDDEPVNRQVLVNHLALQHYHIYEAAGGEEALAQIFSELDFDLVLLDVMMPRMSGFEVCKRLRTRFSMRRLPVIFLTARNQVADLVAGFEVGGNDFLTKPIQKAELLTRVKTHLELLDFNRSLEKKVAVRTRELQRQNLVLDLHNQELETLDNIVKIINREVQFTKVIQALLEQGKKLFPQADKSIYLAYDKEQKAYLPIAAVGHDLEKVRHVALSQNEVFELATSIEEVGAGIFLASGILENTSIEHYEAPQSSIVLSMVVGTEVHGFLMMENMTREDAFESSDVKRLDRFRQHAVSAVAKARVLDDLVATQRRLMETAHMAGKAEIATDVLHSVGNILNSISTSVHLLVEQVQNRRAMSFFGRVLGLLGDHKSDLAGFLTEDPRGRKLPESLDLVYDKMGQHQDLLQQECERLIDHVRSIERVLREQQRHTHALGWMLSPTDLNLLITDLVKSRPLQDDQNQVQLVLDLGDTDLVLAEKDKLRRVLGFLLQNAEDALVGMEMSHQGKIMMRTYQDERGVFCELRDNGVGVPEDQLEQIFVQGYSTKPGNRGFGLHYCANAMTEMSGSIHIQSPGIGAGATVCLQFSRAPDRPEGTSAGSASSEGADKLLPL